ncbi:proteoglycan 4-like isoform X2 [Lepisosteus oculatus]|uniref:proteoglycan 4-like isoform X2 n=1 Tax=Lepisosteus oculatus TaxID=7918 RepID=UPI00371E21BE
MASLWLTVAVLLALCQAATTLRPTQHPETRPTASPPVRQTAHHETRPTVSKTVHPTQPKEPRPTAFTPVRHTEHYETRPTVSKPVRPTQTKETKSTDSTPRRHARSLEDTDTESSELQSLKCYQCVDISEQPNCSSPEEVECRPGLTRCLNMMLIPPAYGITRRCASERECQSLESNPSSFVTARCCDTDLCN